MSNFHVSILAADRNFYEGECEYISVPTVNGSIGILAHHSNTVSAVLPGTLKYRVAGEEEVVAAVASGLVRIQNNDVLVLVDTIELPEEIDANRAKRAADRAQEAMLQRKSRDEYLKAQAEMSRAFARLKVKNSIGR